MLETLETISDPSNRSRTPSERKRVLIVEDDRMNAAAMRSIFTRKGCDVTAVNTLQDAIAMLDGRRDYIVLDLVLPDGDGLEILKRVRAHQGEPAGSCPRVIVTTAVSDEQRIREVLELQPHRLLKKPIDLVDLLSAIGMM